MQKMGIYIRFVLLLFFGHLTNCHWKHSVPKLIITKSVTNYAWIRRTLRCRMWEHAQLSLGRTNGAADGNTTLVVTVYAIFQP